MPKENKTKATSINVFDFIESKVVSDERKSDCYKLIELMKSWSGFEPKIWGTSIIGFGSYHYQYESGHKGDSPLIGFSPRKNELSLYVFSYLIDENKDLLNNLGKYKSGKSCIYIKKLADINIEQLEKICKTNIHFICNKYDCKNS